MAKTKNLHEEVHLKVMRLIAAIAEKAAMTRRFFIRKTEEYELLKAEIALLQSEPVLAENKG